MSFKLNHTFCVSLFVISGLLYTSRAHNCPEEREINLTALFGPQGHTHIPPQSLIAILPVVSGSLHRTPDLLGPFLVPQTHVREVIVVCPETILAGVRGILQQTFASLGSAGHPDITLRPSQDFLDTTTTILRAAADVTTDYVLVMDEKGLTETPQYMLSSLLNPPTVSLPFGPEGELLSNYPSTHFPPLGQIGLAKYLRPPFVVPPSLISSFEQDPPACDFGSWQDIGMCIASHRLDALGGIVLLAESTPPTPSSMTLNEPIVRLKRQRRSCDNPAINTTNSDDTAISFASAPFEVPPGPRVRFIFFFPTRDDLQRASPLICALQLKNEGGRIRVLVYNDEYIKATKVEWETEFIQTLQCVVKYDILTGRTPLSFTTSGSALLSNWLGDPYFRVDIIVSLQEIDALVAFLLSEAKSSIFCGSTIIRIPRLDLHHTQWMSSLSLEEWKNWYIPRVDISVITKDRPHSLTRLLKSLLRIRYFGDPLDLRINVEQDCDMETLQIAENFTWPFGRVFVHHRILHGGLLPAVVESWYPKDTSTYGLLLEDDIELSPLSYAWIKMALLRYRHGDATNRVPNMFGVSLYQQKQLELPLHVKGSRQFNPRSFFSKAGLAHPTTPFLSQVPCSWGAVYFPEHWREFHDYLSIRFAETSMSIEHQVVPAVRSNNWSNSWKKFFIELVHLRGYAMLYPNYEAFLSFSTNHLEVGLHVKDRSVAKTNLFSQPLMQLGMNKLLELPEHTLPRVDKLPILNLTGFLTSLEEIVRTGNSRRLELTHCEDPPEFYDIRSSMCVT
ncbi:hypothetical protein GALMADRAFT_1220405 [Galerina marginata CBS 339.88]|uniref:Glycosyl transferase 64 domain-containing protein n=1 Tax=Galerina marginata (strain CBS 339.88) TaxID=685588 RepID=A0A067S758_GALM3|nr:hypothetical protein GALMADRAFT_1220405 [Galerina marginata CBS 339.88]